MPEALTEERIADFRQRICGEAVSQFVRHGVDKVSMRSLAKAMGYSATALYSYYRNKEEILAAARTACLRELCQRLEAALSLTDDPDACCVAFIGAYLNYAERSRPHYQLAFDLHQPPSARFPELTDVRTLLLRQFGRYIHFATPDGKPVPDNLAPKAWAYLHGLMALSLSGATLSHPQNPELLHREIVSTLITGLADSRDPGPEGERKDGQQMAFRL